MTTTTSLRLGSSELALNTSSALTDTHDEVSLPYIDDISPRELKAAEVMVKEEVRHFFFNAGPYRLFPAFDRSISFCDKSACIASDTIAIQKTTTRR